MRTYIFLFILLTTLISFFCISDTQSQNIRLIPFINGLSSPTCIRADVSGNFYITERAGTIVMTDPEGNPSPGKFLDITDRVKSEGQEQGLLGVELHPDFKNTGYFYVHYTGNGDSVHISRFSVDPTDSLRALPSSELKIMTIYHPFMNHNGGDIHFGPDLMFYIGLGDGGSAGDPGNRAQNKGDLLGKILRVDLLSGDIYTIPPDNPFISDPTARPEIWSLGLRNPWRFSFDRSTGDMWIGDVGQGDREEIDMETDGSSGGKNYGWRCYEGTIPYNTEGCLPQQDYFTPVYEYQHDDSPCWSVTGGYVYRGASYPSMTGKYFFADYCRDFIMTLKDSSGTMVADTAGVFQGNGFSTFGEDRNGELYIAGLTSGIVYKIADSSAAGIDEKYEKLTVYPNPFSERIKFINKGKNIFIITDLAGREVYHSAPGDSDADLSGLAPGAYIIRSDKNFSSGRIIIKR